jgi:hypothetical protein
VKISKRFNLPDWQRYLPPPKKIALKLLRAVFLGGLKRMGKN